MLCGVHVLPLLVVLAGVTHHVLAEPQPITDPCIKMGNDPCRCKMQSGTQKGLIIDLSPLDSGDYLNATFKDIPVDPKYVNSTDLFSWNPCTPFCEVHCEGAATCQIENKTESLYYTIGKHNSADFTVNLTSPNYNTTNLTITYSYVQQGVTRMSVIGLLCDENNDTDTFIAYGELTPKSRVYYFELTSQYACPRNESGPTPTPAPSPPTCPHPWTSATTTTITVPPEPTVTTESPTTPINPSLWGLGWKLWVAVGCLSVVVLVLIYFVIGLSVNLIRGRRGMAVVPHYLCWISCCKCCPSCQRRENRRLLKEYTDDIS